MYKGKEVFNGSVLVSYKNKCKFQFGYLNFSMNMDRDSCHYQLYRNLTRSTNEPICKLLVKYDCYSVEANSALSFIFYSQVTTRKI
jgi:hypothetical protein